MGAEFKRKKEVRALLQARGNAYQREVHNLLFAKREGRKMLVYLSDNSIGHPDADSIEFVPVEDFLLSF